MSALTAAERTEMDQGAMAARVELDGLVATIRSLLGSGVDEAKVTVDLAAHLSDLNDSAVRGLLMAALLSLASTEGPR